MIRQNVSKSPPHWIASQAPLLVGAVHPEAPASGSTGTPSSRVEAVDFEKLFVGEREEPGADPPVDSATSPPGGYRFSACPETYIALLLCEWRVGEVSETSSPDALVLTGSEQFAAFEGGGCALRFVGDYVDTTARADDGSLRSSVVIIDALEQAALSFTEQRLHRELGKALVGFMEPEPLEEQDHSNSTRATDCEYSVERCPTVTIGKWCGRGSSGGGGEMLAAVLQWMAASHVGRRISYDPSDSDSPHTGESLQELMNHVAELVPHEPELPGGERLITVGWMYRALLRFAGLLEQAANGNGELGAVLAHA